MVAADLLVACVKSLFANHRHEGIKNVHGRQNAFDLADFHLP
jgi:hypothetical protein